MTKFVPSPVLSASHPGSGPQEKLCATSGQTPSQSQIETSRVEAPETTHRQGCRDHTMDQPSSTKHEIMIRLAEKSEPSRPWRWLDPECRCCIAWHGVHPRSIAVICPSLHRTRHNWWSETGSAQSFSFSPICHPPPRHYANPDSARESFVAASGCNRFRQSFSSEQRDQGRQAMLDRKIQWERTLDS